MNKKIVLFVVPVLVIITFSVLILNYQPSDFEEDVKINNQDEICKKQNDLPININRKDIENICKPFFDSSYNSFQIFPKNGKNIIDNHGFRCNYQYTGEDVVELCNYPKTKPEDETRIFLVGGSTVFSSNNDNSYTTSAFLEKRILESEITQKIKVINAGISGSWSEQELKLVQDKIIDLEPDVIVVYDGYNDLLHHGNAETWGSNLEEICKLGNEADFKTVILLQPFLGTSKKIFYDEEKSLVSESNLFDQIEHYENFRYQLSYLKNNCYATHDLTAIFDKIPEQIYFDSVHVGVRGDKIIADNIFEIILPIINNEQISKNILFESNQIDVLKDVSKSVNELSEFEYELKNLNFENSELRDLDLMNKKLENSIFYNSDLKNISFKNTDLTGVVFTGATLTNVDFTNAKLDNSIFQKTKMDNVNFNNAQLDGASFIQIDFSDSFIDLNHLMSTELINSKIPDQVSVKDELEEHKQIYKPVMDRETYQKFLVDESCGLYMYEEKCIDIFLPEIYMPVGDRVVAYKLNLKTYKNDICHDITRTTNDRQNCLNLTNEDFSSSLAMIEQTDLDLNEEQNELMKNAMNNPDGVSSETRMIFEKIANNDKDTALVFPTISLYAYSKPCIWDYYEVASDECRNIKMNEGIDYSKFNDKIWLEQGFTEEHTFWYTNLISYQILTLLNYNVISDLEIEKNPNILSNYDKIIVLHNKYVTKNIFDAVTNHPMVIYLHPGALSEEVEIRLPENSFTVLTPIKYPEERNFRNDFLWLYDNSHREFNDCLDIDDPRFEKVPNGIMLNCYPEGFLLRSIELLESIKKYE